MPSSNTSQKNPKITDIKITDLASLQKKKEAESAAPKASRPQRVGGQNIVTVEVPKQKTVESYEPHGVSDTKGVRYSEVLGGVADPTIRKNARFRISELARGPLSVEAEEEARIEAEIQARLEKRLKDIRDEVTQAAHAAGFDQGRKEGKQEVLTQSKPALESFQAMLSDFEHAKVEIFKANEEFLIHMVHQLAKAVILRELKEDSDYTKRLVLHILDRVGTRENVKIFVSEKVFSAAEQLKEGLAQSLGELKNVSVELDSDLTNRGCRVETDFGEVDAKIDNQIQNIAQTLGVVANKT